MDKYIYKMIDKKMVSNIIGFHAVEYLLFYLFWSFMISIF